MTHDLTLLQDTQVQRTILLAELGALFHNVGKMSGRFLAKQRNDPSAADFFYRNITGVLPQHLNARPFPIHPEHAETVSKQRQRSEKFQTKNMLESLAGDVRAAMWEVAFQLSGRLHDRTYHLGDFTEFQWREDWYVARSDGRETIDSLFQEGSAATRLFAYAHGAASGAEKEGIDGDPQTQHPAYAASPYGLEAAITEEVLEKHLEGFVTPYVALVKDPTSLKRDQLLKAMGQASSWGLGDTRRPLNDVTTWNVCHGAATLFKAALAGAALENKWPDLKNLRWRLLRITFDGLDFLAHAHHITDLLGRRATLQAALDAARRVIEVEYPLGNEVYRDENGCVFIVPDADVLSADAGGMTLKNRLLGSLDNGGLRGELVPEIEPGGPHSAEDLGRQAYHRPKRQPINQSDATGLARAWLDSPGKEICTVCGLRPVGWDASDDHRRRVAEARSVCGVCLERHGTRAREWAKSLETTIWIDEVADLDGRVALVVGRFELDHWLDGTYIESTVSRNGVGKNPSFARVRRCWETTLRFWQRAQNEWIPQVVGQTGRRIEIPFQGEPGIYPYYAYDARIGDREIGVIWDRDRNRLLTTSNLEYVAKIAGWSEGALAKIQGAQLTLAEPTGYGQPREPRVVAVVEGKSACTALDRFGPHIPLLAEPLIFMALIPADKTLPVAHAIKTSYEKEMGKVRNRLPLHLGVIFFPRRTPIYAVVDAGRRMLALSGPESIWDVRGKRDTADGVELALCEQESGRELSLTVKTQLGDGQRDCYYPYFFLATGPDADAFECKRPDGSSAKLLHVSSLEPNRHAVYFTPARFDFEFLDVTGRRFEISYAGSQRRGSANRPFVLEDLDRLETLWRLLAGRGHLSTSQIQNLEGLLIGRLTEWHGLDVSTASGDPTYRQFAAETLANVSGSWWRSLEEDQRKQLTAAAQSGELLDLLDLKLHILKERAQAD